MAHLAADDCQLPLEQHRKRAPFLPRLSYISRTAEEDVGAAETIGGITSPVTVR